MLGVCIYEAILKKTVYKLTAKYLLFKFKKNILSRRTRYGEFMNLKLFISCFIFSFVYSCDVEDIVVPNVLIENSIKVYNQDSDDLYYDPGSLRIPSYRRGHYSYGEFLNPRLFELNIHKDCSFFYNYNDMYKKSDSILICIIGYDEVKESENSNKILLPFVIAGLNKADNILLARFRFFISKEKNEATIYESSFVEPNEKNNSTLHLNLMNRLKKFCQENSVKSIKPHILTFELDNFFVSHGYPRHYSHDFLTS